MKTKRLRKPGMFATRNIDPVRFEVARDEKGIFIDVPSPGWMSLASAKKLKEWIDRVIEYEGQNL